MKHSAFWRAIPDEYCFNFTSEAKPGKGLLLIFGNAGGYTQAFIPSEAIKWNPAKLRRYFIDPMIAALKALET